MPRAGHETRFSVLGPLVDSADTNTRAFRAFEGQFGRKYSMLWNAGKETPPSDSCAVWAQEVFKDRINGSAFLFFGYVEPSPRS